MLDAVCRFCAERVFGPDRAALLAVDLAGGDDRAAAARQTERERLERVVADLVRRRRGLVRQAQGGDPDDPFTKAPRHGCNGLEKEKRTALSAVCDLDTADAADTARPGPADIALLDALHRHTQG
ncbi:hypothetical protein [Pseudonocardia humida]|uniref:Uncharacterized protein n=1 Tax=Pseudonocardia humida TaxID=2800819 RepID=A0ABT1A443_9PSEU|nr:hypothetical protein [Pseudonocardia humida]MCO1657774.1 hypothetical protein [Pseudonocardia humida]